mmetsp:Transcript_6104/g.12504  ORF Transcript_6104/g.12504 Transcript_6104/m.12504 type:complete len:288 (+) Transcript_6104:74-937(+)
MMSTSNDCIEKIGRSELVKVVTKRWHLHFNVLPLPHSQDKVLHLRFCLHGVSDHVVPVVKDALREGLATGLLAQSGNEPEGLGNWQVCLHLNERRALAGILLEDTATSQVHAGVDATHGLLWASDLNEEHRFLQRWLARHLCRKAAAARGRHDLPCATVDCVGVQCHIHQVELDATHVLLTERPLLGCPLEGAVYMLLDLNEILNAYCRVHHKIGTLGLGAPAPDLARHGVIPVKLLLQYLCSLLDLGLRPNLATLDLHAELLRHRLRLDVDAVVLVGRLGEARLGG